MCKVISTVPSLAWLRRALRRWCSRAAASVRPDKESTTVDTAVPAGHVAVRVEGGRFAVRLAHLSHPAFLELLRQAEEEYGFASASGPLALPCDEHRLRDVLRRVSSSSDDGSHEEQRRSFRRRRGDSRPLLQGMTVEELVRVHLVPFLQERTYKPASASAAASCQQPAAGTYSARVHAAAPCHPWCSVRALKTLETAG